MVETISSISTICYDHQLKKINYCSSHTFSMMNFQIIKKTTCAYLHNRKRKITEPLCFVLLHCVRVEVASRGSAACEAE